MHRHIITKVRAQQKKVLFVAYIPPNNVSVVTGRRFLVVPPAVYFYQKLIIKRHFRFPDFPHLADKIWAGFECRFARFPTGRSGFRAFAVADMLESLNLPNAFHHISSHGRSKDFKPLNDAIGINNKSATSFHSRVLQIDAENAAHLAASIGEHGEGDAAFDHFGEFMVIPHLVDKDTVHAHGKNFDAQFLELGIFLADRRDFRCSDESKISGIETKDYPFAKIF